jgi:glucose-6-phosphate 1-epimerase
VITLYEYMQQPRFWIARDEDGYWLVPARDDGWSERSPFVGRTSNLCELRDLDGIALGLPAARSDDNVA